MCNTCGGVLSKCSEVKVCGCESIAEGTCVEYTGRCLPTSGINTNDDLNKVVRKIDDRLTDLNFQVSNVFRGISIGGKYDLYNGYGEGGVNVFKTLDVGPGIDIKDSDGVLKFSISEEYIREKVLDYLTELKLV